MLFSEPVDPTSGTVPGNYTLDRGVVVTGARLGVDPGTVVLTTSPLSAVGDYLLSVRNVRDRASLPNAIAIRNRTK